MQTQSHIRILFGMVHYPRFSKWPEECCQCCKTGRKIHSESRNRTRAPIGMVLRAHAGGFDSENSPVTPRNCARRKSFSLFPNCCRARIRMYRIRIFQAGRQSSGNESRDLSDWKSRCASNFGSLFPIWIIVTKSGEWGSLSLLSSPIIFQNLAKIIRLEIILMNCSKTPTYMLVCFVIQTCIIVFSATFLK